MQSCHPPLRAAWSPSLQLISGSALSVGRLSQMMAHTCRLCCSSGPTCPPRGGVAVVTPAAAGTNGSMHNSHLGRLSGVINWRYTDYRPIIGICRLLASMPIIGIGHLTIGQLFVSVSKTTKMLLTAVDIDDSEITNDSVISHVSSSVRS